MGELGLLIILWASIYLLTGALMGTLVARKLQPLAAKSAQPRLRGFATFLASKPGLVVAVVFWPVLVTVYRLGFFLGAWDWKATRSSTDRLH